MYREVIFSTCPYRCVMMSWGTTATASRKMEKDHITSNSHLPGSWNASEKPLDSLNTTARAMQGKMANRRLNVSLEPSYVEDQGFYKFREGRGGVEAREEWHERRATKPHIKSKHEGSTRRKNAAPFFCMRAIKPLAGGLGKKSPFMPRHSPQSECHTL